MSLLMMNHADPRRSYRHWTQIWVCLNTANHHKPPKIHPTTQ